MNRIIELLRANRDNVFVDADGIEQRFELLPPLSEQELTAFETSLPCPLPEEIRELLSFASGFKGCATTSSRSPMGASPVQPKRHSRSWYRRVLEEVTFGGPDPSFGLEDIFPYAIPLAGDGFGNFWIVDLTSESQSWGPIFYACHDAPVIVYQAESLLPFLQEVIRFGKKPLKSEIDDVHELMSSRIWRENPGVLSYDECLAVGDAELMVFAESLDQTWQFIDLRNPKLGDGFSWGRYGPKTSNKRFGEKHIFAYQKKGWRQRFIDAWR